MGSELTMLFEGGKRKALTFSYDDGTIYDKKLVSLLKKYDMKATFNLNSGLLGQKEHRMINGINTDFSQIEPWEVKTVYADQEVASHTVNHSSIVGLSQNMGAAEVLKNKQKLEELTGRPVRGFAYPYGSYNELAEEILSACGIEYARTADSSNDFDIPQDFLEWHPTCHHDAPELLKLAENFCNNDSLQPQLFCIWGRSYEFAQKDNWQVLEEFMKYVSDYREKIWFATSIEIVDYVKAFRELRCSSDGRILQNPTEMTLWFEMDREIHCIHGNEKFESL
ncbi:MAG: polysaccharide deacetylase family protein [Lachnospiraceae bacterium]|nr:polysaccharide deacetylase family protein [Lachnospiraceae bacterium]MCI7190563.1 polysaccharide deacetylase family protein [Lachnospiraceae bacterium]MDD7626950.1 polysaccharide deacetylase family protein [Lachnospiraceae bacterium]MDY4119226.1 polysaccharide deacetylase family protein [Lachnospiraceae bacterium]